MLNMADIRPATTSALVNIRPCRTQSRGCFQKHDVKRAKPRVESRTSPLAASWTSHSLSSSLSAPAAPQPLHRSEKLDGFTGDDQQMHGHDVSGDHKKVNAAEACGRSNQRQLSSCGGQINATVSILSVDDTGGDVTLTLLHRQTSI